jgi:hypothetical protein
MKCSASIPIKRFRQIFSCLAALFLVLYFNVTTVNASEISVKIFSPTDTVDTLGAGSVKIIQSQSIGKLVKAQIAYNKGLKEVDGYRIQIFSENGATAKTDAANARLAFTNKYHGVEAYLSYKQPYFKICVGDFKTQLDARTALLKILRVYPNAIIVREKVLP